MVQVTLSSERIGRFTTQAPHTIMSAEAPFPQGIPNIEDYRREIRHATYQPPYGLGNGDTTAFVCDNNLMIMGRRHDRHETTKGV